ncbi:MAG: hypothetical protein LAP13_22090 [Acidobacteriia bacterium]|nr:hypothetical protein [Terriglobia bacterium]
MENLLLIPLVGLGLCLAYLAAQAFVEYAGIFIADAMYSFTELSDDISKGADNARQRRYREHRKREFLMWLNAKMGIGETSGFATDQVHEAQKQAPILRRLLKDEIPAMTLRCCKTHRLVGWASEAEYIYEVSGEPECRGLRERMVDLVEASVSMIQQYPFYLDDEILLQNLIVLRKRILPICRECPYLSHAVVEAPLLCPAAVIAGAKPEGDKCHDQRKRK